MSNPEAQDNAAPRDDLLWRHLKSLPAFRALLRAVEARFYRHLQIPEPVLDLGCGDGHFAGMAFDAPLAAGVDPWWGPLSKARHTGVYRLNVQAMGDRLPFADGTFASVISNSVLEHIPDIQPVLDEASRVLRPGGKLVITMPSHLFTENLGGAALLRPFGLDDVYRRFFNRISRHAHTDPPERWAQRLAQAGFSVERWQYYFSKEALRALEVGHVQGFPSAILHFLTGHWIIAPWRENLRRTEQWLRPYYEEEPQETGAYIFILAQKTSAPLDVSQTDSIEVRLPPPRPLPTVEPTVEDIPPAGEPAQEAEPLAAASKVDDGNVFRYRLAREPAAPASQPRVTGRNHPTLGLALLLAALLAAVTGQSLLGQRLPSPWPGLAWYGAAFIAFAGAAVLIQQRWRLPSLSGVSRRALLFPLAFVLSLLAQEQSGASPFAGNPLLAFVLWLAGTALAVFAFSSLPVETEDTSRQPAREEPWNEPANSAPGTPDEPPPPLPISLVVAALCLVGLIPRLIALTGHPFILNGIEASIGLDAVSVLQGQIRNPFATSWLSNPTFPLYPAALPIALFGRSILGLRLLPAIIGAATIPVLFLIARRLWGFWFALTAALFLSGYHLHVHYSRLGMTNIWDPLLALLVFGALAYALAHPDRRAWLWAGAVAGLSAYFYTTSHLIPFFLAGFALYLFIVRRDLLAAQWRHMLAAAALALVVALPQIVYYQAHPQLFMERANALGIFQSGWLVQQAAAGQSAAAVLGDQLRRAFLAFNGSLDTSTSYNPGIPLLRTWPSIIFALGVVLSLWRVRQPRYALLLIWLLVTLLFGGALLIDAPGSHRVLISAPFVAILAITGLFWLAGLLHAALKTFGSPSTAPAGRRLLPPRVAAILLITLFFVAGDLFFYFGQYRQSQRFADRNSEVAHEVGLYLDSLQGPWQAYFHAPPAMYVTFPTLVFLAETFQPGGNLLDVAEDTAEAPDGPPGANLVFIYLPERSAEVNQTSQRYPQGTFLTFDGVLQNPLFYSYEVRP